MIRRGFRFLDGFCVAFLVCTGASAELQNLYKTYAICTGEKAGDVERNAAQLLAERMARTPGIAVRVDEASEGRRRNDGELAILLGIPEHHRELTRLLAEAKVKPLTERDPGPEGFVLRSHGDTLLAAGIDERGVVYAVGEMLRAFNSYVRVRPFAGWEGPGRKEAKPEFTGFSFPISLRTAPAFEVRGTQFGQSGVAKQKAKVREWTVAETQEKIAERALAGANTLEVAEDVAADDPVYRYIKGLGLKSLVHYSVNAGQGPPEWQAQESIGRQGYLCPSVPEARQALLAQVEAIFSESPDFDYVRLSGGDGGGCECDRCDPYGRTFILLCADMADVIHKYHPNTEIFITNQKFDNDDDIAIFEYLREEPRTWLRAFCMGPGSDATTWQPGHRQHHRMDLFRYPGFGPYSLYPEEILHQLPPEQDLVFFNEITHWRYAQNAYVQAYPRPDKDGNHPPHWNHFIYERMPDRFLTQVYDRLTFYAWPRFYHWVFGETVRYGIGDVTHSSGTHDHFNQWMWQRLLWNPRQTPEQVVDEYARTWFGPEAAPLMAEAIFLMEEYLENDPDKLITEKESINKYYELVKHAGEKMPAHLRENSWLWREYMQKGCVDKRTKLAVAQQTALQKRVEERCTEALKSGELDDALAEALSWFDELRETDEMRALREEGMRLGEESDALYGVRSDGLFSLDHDFIGLGWYKRQLERARSAAPEDKREMVSLIADYENPGEGGSYDNCGTYESAPHLVNGYPYDHGQPYVSQMLDEANKLSQRTMCFTQDEQQGVAFRYEGLDPNVQYRVRMTFVRPWYQERYRARMNQHAQSVYADDIPLARGVELPERMSEFFTYDIPREATADGVLIIRLEKMPDVASGDRVSVEQWRNSGGWGTLISEIWLMKKQVQP